MFGERADHGCGVPARDLEKHHKAGMALDQRRDVRVVRPGEKISFPVTWHGAVLSLGWPVADGGRIHDLFPCARGVAALGLTHLPHRPQMRISRLTVEGDRRRPCAIRRIDGPAAIPRKLSTRSSMLRPPP